MIVSARAWIAIAAAGLLLAACQAPILDPKIDAVANACFDDAVRGDTVAFDTLAAANLRTPVALAEFSKFRTFIANRNLRGRKSVGWRISDGPLGERTGLVSDEYDYGDILILWKTYLHKASAAAPWEIRHWSWESATPRELAANRFTLTGKTLSQWDFILMTAMSPGLMIVALAKVISTRGLRRKWLWGIGAFFGLFSFQMDWTTGQIFSNFLTVQLIGAGATRGVSSFNSWVLTMTLPVGAALILMRVWANPERADETSPE